MIKEAFNTARMDCHRLVLITSVFLVSLLLFIMTGCGQEKVASPDIEYYDNGYGTFFVLGTRIEHPADTSTSTVVDWSKQPAAKAPKDLRIAEEHGIVYSHSTMKDGKDDGKPLDLHLNLMIPADAAGEPADAAANEPAGTAANEPADAAANEPAAATTDEPAAAATDGSASGTAKSSGEREKLHPVVLLVPGGGFMTCRIDNKYMEVQRYLAAHGYAIAIIQYHIIGQGRYMDAADDVRAAIQWVRDHGTEYGLDADRIALMGNSAGGYVAALAACQGMPEDTGKGVDKDTDKDVASKSTAKELPGVRCVVNFYGLSDLLNNKADYEDAAIEAEYRPESSDSQFVNGVYSGLGLPDDPEEAKKADLATYIDGAEPPFLHFHGDADLWVSPSQSVHLHETLLAAGVETTRYSVIGAGHADKAFRTKDALDLALAFLDKYCLSGTETTESTDESTTESANE